MGCIDRLIEGKDGVIRGAVLKVVSNNRVYTVERPLQKLCLLELYAEESNVEEDNFDENDSLPPKYSRCSSYCKRKNQELSGHFRKSGIHLIGGESMMILEIMAKQTTLILHIILLLELDIILILYTLPLF